MPEIARFYGISIRGYFLGKEHNPPHIHARYGEDFAEIDIYTGEIIVGYLPEKARAMVKEWTTIHTSELDEIWHTQVFRKLTPLE